MPFIPHTPDDVEHMLKSIGATSIADLFDEIPPELRVDSLEGIGDALTESQISRLMLERSRRDGLNACFIGAGAYEHYIPAAIWDIVTRGEFYSAYTPYQAEASQGTLQVIYEFQTMMASLMGLDVANASLYDGATAFAEACLMAVRANRKSKSRRILVSAGINPVYLDVTRAIVRGQGIELVELPLADGVSDVSHLDSLADEEFAAVALQQPTWLGTLDNVDEVTDWAASRKALTIGVVNPMAMAMLKPPGQWGTEGADIACGEGQPLGVPLSAGGPYFGFMVCAQPIVRQMPGRIVGRTVDLDGRPGFALTLQAREQHIRRSKATSNICTNQGLMVTAATIYMSLLGSHGLRDVAMTCHQRTRQLVERLTALPGVAAANDRPVFHEAVLTFDQPVAPLLEALAARGIEGGLDISGRIPGAEHALLVCATECRTDDDIERYATELAALLAGEGA